MPPPTSPIPLPSWALLLPTLCGSPELDNWELSTDGGGRQLPPGSRVTITDTDTAVSRVGSSPSDYKAGDLPAAQAVVSSPWGPAALEDCAAVTREPELGRRGGSTGSGGGRVVINRDDERKQLKWHRGTETLEPRSHPPCPEAQEGEESPLEFSHEAV